ARKQRSELRFDPIVSRVQHLPPRDDDHVHCGGGLVVTKQLANETLGAISLDGGAHFSSGCNTQTRRSRLTFPGEHGHEATGSLETCFIDKLEVGPLTHMLAGQESSGLEAL